MPSTDPNFVRDWLKALGVFCATNADSGDARAKVDAYAPMLAQDFSPWAFTPGSLAAVAKGTKFFPTYGELNASLEAWCRDNRPQAAPAIAGPEAPHLDGQSAVWLHSIEGRLAAGANLETLLTIARRHAPKAALAEIERRYCPPQPKDEMRPVQVPDLRVRYPHTKKSAEAPAAPAQIKSGALSPEQLAAAYREKGIAMPGRGM